MMRGRIPLTEAMQRSLNLIAAHGAAIRVMDTVPRGSVYQWQINGKPLSRSVESLYSGGYLEPPKDGDPHKLVISEAGALALGVAPLTQKRAA